MTLLHKDPTEHYTQPSFESKKYVQSQKHDSSNHAPNLGPTSSGVPTLVTLRGLDRIHNQAKYLKRKTTEQLIPLGSASDEHPDKRAKTELKRDATKVIDTPSGLKGSTTRDIKDGIDYNARASGDTEEGVQRTDHSPDDAVLKATPEF
ncbi:hypothetical protein FRB90_000729 [Tulasnella sp. 427]|nr:hypothetical protein FRB90_000729 [Tulasnella sp. 427]